jgi:hypothetical protein
VRPLGNQKPIVLTESSEATARGTRVRPYTQGFSGIVGAQKVSQDRQIESLSLGYKVIK